MIKDKEKRKAIDRRYYEKHKKELRAYALEYYNKHKEERKEKVKEYDRQRTLNENKLVFDHYGWKCICCGETEPTFLTIDHIEGNGTKHIKSIGGHFHRWLIKNNFPKGYQTLCYNCNCSRDKNKDRQCVHTKNNLSKIV
jgi:hypothetical protein